MFTRYFKIAWRNMLSSKIYSALNVVGLATGMAVALLIGLWVYHQYSYDRFFPGYEQVYQARYKLVRNGEPETQRSTSLLLAGALKNEIPEIKYVTQTDWEGDHGLMAGDKKIYLSGIMAGADFLKIFPCSLLDGSADAALSNTYSIVLSQSTARALFGNDNPMNKIVRIDNVHDLKVTGLMKDLPANSTFGFKYIVPFSYYVETADWVKKATTTWDQNSFQTFVVLQPGASYAQVEPKLKKIIKKYKPDWDKAVHAEIFMHPMKHWHLYTTFKNGVATGGFIDYVRMFSIIGILVLLIACINFTNLSTARSEKRAREVGIRKTIGSGRRELVIQFLLESEVYAITSFILCLLMVQLALPAFNRLTGNEITVPYTHIYFWLIMIGYVLLTGLLAGCRPAFFLSAFNPVQVLKGGTSTGKASVLPRKILVVLQFSCSIALIISTIIVYRQIQYAKNRSAGFDASRLVMTDNSPDLARNYTALRNELLQSGLVSHVTKASSPVTSIWSWNGIDDWQGKQPDETLNVASIHIADDYFATLGMQLKEGQNFTGNIAADSLYVILNEAAVKRMRFKEPLRQVITWYGKQQQIRVTGVVKDALMLSPFSPAEPTFFVYGSVGENGGVIMYRLSPNVNTHKAIEGIEHIFNKYNPAYPFLYHFADEGYASKFNLESLIGRLAGLFAGLAIFISCLGLFGLSAYTAERRNKEIGIRKTLGASVYKLWLMLSREFIYLVLISCVIASPIAFYFLHNWLNQYNYRISIGAGVFMAATAITLLITIVTVSFQAIRAALTNPVKSLRSE